MFFLTFVLAYPAVLSRGIVTFVVRVFPFQSGI
jgi:hypothetical protein